MVCSTTFLVGLNFLEIMSTTEESLTHWKKNIDSRYISGEDLKAELKGLKAEMNVVITHFQDSETFDQSDQSKKVKTGFFLAELPSKTPLYKPMILNATNAKFCAKEFGSDFMEHWIDKPLVLFAMPDKRFGHVARFKKYTAPVVVDEKAAIAKLTPSKTLAELQTNWSSLTSAEQSNAAVIAEKDRLKGILK